MNFFGRLFGTFLDPDRTMKAVTARPAWVEALVILLILLAIYSYLLFPLGQEETLKSMEDGATRLKEKWGEDRYAAAVERVGNQSRALTSLLFAPLISLVGFLFSSLLVLGIGRLSSTQGNYLQVFSSFLHANFIDKVLGNGLRYFLATSRGSVMQTTTGLPVFFPRMDVASTSYAVLSQVDFFQLWMFGVFGLGLASAFKFSVKRALIISYCFWALKSVLMAALAIARAKMM
ncbi:MAG: YIP1 family protein [Acidobacteriota bacterium]